MKLKDLDEGKVYFRKLVLEIGKRVPEATFRKQEGDPWHLAATWFAEHKDKPHPYKIDLHYGDKHPLMFLTAEFAPSDASFLANVYDAIKASGLIEVQKSSTVDNGFYTVSFNFVR